ncbi:MAG: transposase, partial [Paramuribaculum sp.]|nr:transposase [Paramuribaculum sp.]
MSKVLAYYHIVFCTKERRMTLPLSQCEHLYRYIWRELTDCNCLLLRIGGIQNHI